MNLPVIPIVNNYFLGADMGNVVESHVLFPFWPPSHWTPCVGEHPLKQQCSTLVIWTRRLFLNTRTAKDGLEKDVHAKSPWENNLARLQGRRTQLSEFEPFCLAAIVQFWMSSSLDNIIAITSDQVHIYLVVLHCIFYCTHFMYVLYFNSIFPVCKSTCK